MRRNGYFGASGQTSDPAIRSGDLGFLWDKRISTTEVSVLTYKTLNTSLPQYLSQHINRRVSAWALRSSELRQCSSDRSILPILRSVLFDVFR